MPNPDLAPDDLKIHSVCDGGNLDCGSGLLLIIRRAMEGVPEREILEIRSTEISVREDLPAWCRLTGNPYLGWRPGDGYNSFLVRRGDQAAESKAHDEQARNYRWQCRVRWAGGETARVYARNHQWEAGQPASFNLQDAAPSAVEHLLGALGACLAMGFQVHASRQGIAVDELELSLGGRLDNIFVFLGTETVGHSGFKEITGSLFVSADAESEKLEEIWAQTIAVSPIANTLLRGTRIQVEIKSGF